MFWDTGLYNNMKLNILTLHGFNPLDIFYLFKLVICENQKSVSANFYQLLHSSKVVVIDANSQFPTLEFISNSLSGR